MAESPSQCKVNEALSIVTGKWKPMILFHLLRNETLRFSELKNKIPEITQKMLTAQLRELEKEDLIERVVYPQVPPKVEYSMTDHGRTLEPILHMMHLWGTEHLQHMQSKQAKATLAQ